MQIQQKSSIKQLNGPEQLTLQLGVKAPSAYANQVHYESNIRSYIQCLVFALLFAVACES